MLVGVDWGGTKIEAIAIADGGQTIARESVYLWRYWEFNCSARARFRNRL